MTINTWSHDEQKVFLQHGTTAPALLQQWITRWHAVPTTRVTASHDPEYVLRAGASRGDVREETASVYHNTAQAWLIPSTEATEELNKLLTYGISQETARQMPWEAKVSSWLAERGYRFD